MVSTRVNIPGYRISEELYNGCRTQVYRGYRETDSLRVVIKLLKNPYPSFGELLSFRNQYTIAKNLNSPLFIQTYSLQAYQNAYALVMEDFGGISLKDYFTSVETRYIASLQQFLEIAIALCNILDILYRERIIHKDIKPANILINPETKQVKLIDFSIASLLPRETQTLINPNVLEGTLAYISPEQTGRMNRGIDYRTDFYSLGVTFYELLTGELPFPSNDAMELVHCHIAKEALLVDEINLKIPPVLSEIVKKLMAKNAESRYQSALGLKFDLENCLHQLQESGNIEDFEIARRDVCDRFIIPEKLYGRETEVSTLLQAFERVSLGATEMMLVAGFSGIGKTAVVNEVHKPIVRQRGYFIKGKYDQFQRNIPFSAFVQAFRDLMGQLLTESDAQILQWKNKILEALGDNGQVVIEVIPELSRIIGQQPAAVELSGTATQNRFNLLFQRFTQVFTSFEHPLVMFLDDLQWADSASLNLMQILMTDTSYLFLIGAYRDNEVSPAHTLMLTLSEMQKKQATINTILLAPLNQGQVNQLVADTLKCTESLALPLSQLISQKTQGNPFFTTQFIKALYQDQLIQFDFKFGCWQCDIAQVSQQAATDDVVEFLALQLQKLPTQTQEVFKLAACIGNQFDLSTLAIVSQQSETETAAYLWRGLQEGLILPISETYKFFQSKESDQTNHNFDITVPYKFLHDRVQQAAYSLIPEEQKQHTHLQIGRLLLANTPAQQQSERLFEIVNHLNIAIALLHEQSEREMLAQLNLRAAEKARASTAYTAAFNYAQIGTQLLGTSGWKKQYSLTLALSETLAEAAFLNRDFEVVPALVKLVLDHAQIPLDRVKTYETIIQFYTVQKQYQEAIACGLEILQQLGIKLSPQPHRLILLQELVKTKIALWGKSNERLLALPETTAPEKTAPLQILDILLIPAYFCCQELMVVLATVGVQLTLRYGSTPWAASFYGTYGLILSSLGDLKQSYRLGKLAIILSDRFTNLSITAKVKALTPWFSQPWREDFHSSLPIIEDSIKAATDSGNLTSMGLAAYLSVVIRFYLGIPLDELEAKMSTIAGIVAQSKDESSQQLLAIYHQTFCNLRETSTEPFNLLGVGGDEMKLISLWEERDEASTLATFYSLKTFLAYVFEDIPKALSYADAQLPYEYSETGCYPITQIWMVDALTRLAAYAQSSDRVKKQLLKRVIVNQRHLWKRAQLMPANFQHKYDLVEAEKCRVLTNFTRAMELYDRAIAGAKQNNYIQQEALSNELAAKFYLNWGKEKVAVAYMQEAYYCYARWDAKAKTDDLEKRYPQLLQPILQQQQINLTHNETIATIAQTSNFSSTYTSIISISDVLDLTSILKAAQTISSSIKLDELVASLTKIILENSGAKKSVLILPLEDTWQVQAITLINHRDNSQAQIQTILEPQLIDTCQDIPRKIINYVKNTQKTIVIDNCQTNISGVIGEYMLQHQPQSVLCTPIINQGNLVGILYLENQLTSGVFTTERLQVIHLLASQAAISLENARLYQQAGQALQDLQQAQLQIVQSEKMSALGNLVAGVAHEMNNPLGFISASLEQAKPTFTDIIEHWKLYQENFPNKSEEIKSHESEIDLEYTLEDLPKIIDSMSMACDRLKNISTSLRTFSRADQDYKVKFNIHEGIDSTILILKHRLKANQQRPGIEVVTNYGNFPQVECFPGQLNQVFMNLIANAIDALDESNHGHSFQEIKANPNCITITTSVKNDLVKIAIADNGKGINESVKQKIFDHLFTTKGVGKGTGLGLAIARQIVEETHAGKLSFNSVLGEGTKFIIEIPV
ncbi:ATP-binding sensor histidine kinase [Nostoc sp.]|uniref:ATP-binding sensor histidine kinase n=1 Tax=Nostoc sp. TaxID=1180 RepID=UPI002FF59B5A